MSFIFSSYPFKAKFELKLLFDFDNNKISYSLQKVKIKKNKRRCRKSLLDED